MYLPATGQALFLERELHLVLSGGGVRPVPTFWK